MIKNITSLSVTFLCALFVSTGSAYAQNASPEVDIKEYGLIDPPACVTSSGKTIQYYPGTSEQIVQFGGFLAAAGDFEVGKNGGIVNEDRIYYDETNMPFLHPLFQEFLFRHECAHVTQSHLEIPVGERMGQYWTIEQGADCEALAEISEGNSNFAEDANTVLTNFEKIANIMMQSGGGNAEAREKFVNQRLANMMECPVFNK